MPGVFYRIIVAVLMFLFLVAIIPPLMGLLGFTIPANAEQVIRLCAAAIAVFYIIFGPTPPAFWRS